MIAAFLATVLFGTRFIAFQAIGRIFYLQAQNQTLYFRYFSENPKVWFSTTPFGAVLIEYPYEVAIGAHLGNVYRNGGAFMNSGYLGDGYMHAGFLGIIIVSLLFGITLFTVRVLTQSVPVEKSSLVIAALMGPFFNLSQSGLTVALATNGMVFGFGLVVIYTGMDDENAPPWLKSSKVFQSYRKLNSLFAIAYENSRTKHASDRFD